MTFVMSGCAPHVNTRGRVRILFEHDDLTYEIFNKIPPIFGRDLFVVLSESVLRVGTGARLTQNQRDEEISQRVFHFECASVAGYSLWTFDTTLVCGHTTRARHRVNSGTAFK